MCSGTGRQAGSGERPISREPFVVSRPLRWPWLLQERETECSHGDDSHVPIPGAGGGEGRVPAPTSGLLLVRNSERTRGGSPGLEKSQVQEKGEDPGKKWHKPQGRRCPVQPPHV